MKKTPSRILAVLLCFVMVLQMSDSLIAFALDDPTQDIVLTVPETLQDGGNYFFVPQDFIVSENSTDPIYIPIQRTGDLSAEADVTLKLADLTAHYGVNYTAEIHRQKAEAEVAYGGVAMVDIFQNAEIEEVDPQEEKNEVGQAVYDAGGADFVDAEGTVVGKLTAVPLDENGNPIPEEETEAPRTEDADSEENSPPPPQMTTLPQNLRRLRQRKSPWRPRPRRSLSQSSHPPRSPCGRPGTASPAPSLTGSSSPAARN